MTGMNGTGLSIVSPHSTHSKRCANVPVLGFGLDELLEARPFLWIDRCPLFVSIRFVRELNAAIDSYIEVHNRTPKPFVWTATAKSIFEKIEAGSI